MSRCDTGAIVGVRWLLLLPKALRYRAGSNSSNR